MRSREYWHLNSKPVARRGRKASGLESSWNSKDSGVAGRAPVTRPAVILRPLRSQAIDRSPGFFTGRGKCMPRRTPHPRYRGFTAIAVVAVLSGCQLDGSTASRATSTLNSRGSFGSASGAISRPPVATVPAKTVGWASLSWQNPAQNTDGTPLANLAGYRIYYGTDPANLAPLAQISDPATTSYTANNLKAGTYYFALTAVNSAGVESSRSAVASKIVT